MIGDTGATPLHPARPEFALALTIGFVRESTGEEIAPLEVCLARPAPRDASEHDRFFRTRVRFDAESNSMIVSAADASRPLRTADAALSSIVRRRLDKALAELDRRDSTGRLSNRVRDIIAGNLGKTPLTVETLAAMMAMSRRTLSRRLADEGTSFRSIVDDVRLEFARALLRDPSLSVGEIAFFLQYSEPAAFNRSFRRWTGRTPRAYRNA